MRIRRNIFSIIDKEKWDRRECFEHFINVASCSYSITVEEEITNIHDFIRKNNLRAYPTFMWVIAKCINDQKEFRMGYNQDGQVGYFDKVNPSYSVLNEKTKVMADLCTEYNENFNEFYSDMVDSLDNYKKDTSYSTKFCPNFFIASCLPWISYSSFNVNNEGGQPFLFPMVTWGKFYEKDKKIYMPITIQIHHAAADGYHCSLFFNCLDNIFEKPEEYLDLTGKEI